MAVEIIRREGLSDGKVVAVWEEGAGFVEAADGLRFAEDDRYAEYDEEMLYAEFDGPDYFATEATRQKTLSATRADSLAKGGDGSRVYVDSVEEAPDDVTVHCEPNDEAEDRLYYEP